MENNPNLRELFTQAMSAFVGHEYMKSVGILTEVINRDRNHRPALTTRGAAFFRLGNHEAALSDLDKAIALSEGNARAFHLRGLVWEKMDDDENALKDFDKAIELDPEYGTAYYSRAALNAKLGRDEAASNDIQMFTHLTNVNLETFTNENNILQSRHLQMEETYLESELDR